MFVSNKKYLAILAISMSIITVLGGCATNTIQSNQPTSQDPTSSTISEFETTTETALSAVATTEDTHQTSPITTTDPEATESNKETMTTQPSEPSATTPYATVPPATDVPGETTGTPSFGRADPSTGISWDGVSPIIYTYPDGTTGTEPRPGATYESVPGVISTYTGYIVGSGAQTPEDGVYYCDYCGRVDGDGSNGTCIRWDFVPGDHPCPCCGATVPEYTCHTCE